MPLRLNFDLVLVRHGQSEGNAMNRTLEAGKTEALTDEFRKRDTVSWRLTSLGRTQAKMAGDWLKKRFDNGRIFSRFITSDYYRAMETSALLDLPSALWERDFFITERDWGDLHESSVEKRREKYGDALKKLEPEPFFWKADGGHRFVELCHLVEWFLFKLNKECQGRNEKVLVVCHGETMRAFQVVIEGMSQERFKEMHRAGVGEFTIFNGQIIWYSRSGPSQREEPAARWVRMIRPTTTPVWDTSWKQLVWPRYSNEGLLKLVNQNEV